MDGWTTFLKIRSSGLNNLEDAKPVVLDIHQEMHVLLHWYIFLHSKTIALKKSLNHDLSYAVEELTVARRSLSPLGLFNKKI